MMNHAIVRVFDAFYRAEGARNVLLADGFDADGVRLSIWPDEAGPVEGNFVTGNSPPECVGHTYGDNYANVANRGHCLLMVDADDAAMAARAAGIMEGFGARDPDQLRRSG